MTWETVIGLEVHAQLNTLTKLFSNGCTTYGSAPNTQATLIDAGFPGTLPVLNKQAVHLAIQFGLAINATIQQNSYFERKNYVYPDLPKGYQITQFRRPIVINGYLDILDEQTQAKRIIIEHAHLEEDAGKSIHSRAQQTAIDLNRAGIPLIEIVTSPCLANATEVVNYLKSLNQLLRFLDVCNGNMQEGSFRCDVNLSLKRIGATTLGTRVELKNLNSYRFIEKAIHFEQHRQMDLLNAQLPVIQETRLYNETTQCTESMREKEHENDYRYFPDPDLLPVFISDQLLNTLSTHLPELPSAIISRLARDGLTQADDRDYLLSSPAILQYYDNVKLTCHAPAKVIVNWLKGPIAALLNERQQTFETLLNHTAVRLGELLNLVADETLSAQAGKALLRPLFDGIEPLSSLIQASGYQASSKEDIQEHINAMLKQYPQQVAQYQQGDPKIISFLMGQILKALKGKVDPKKLQMLLTQRLDAT